MPNVLTEGSIVVCAHQGTITFTASQHKLKVNGSAVLVESDATTGVVSGCLNVTNPTTGAVQCTIVTSLLPGGSATKFTLGGSPVMLETAMGLTDGVPPSPWQVQSAGQTKLNVI
jgi:hypothetical protein